MPKITAQNALQFKGFISPRYTQVPDELFDDLMAHLSGAELKVLLYIIRRTFGFKKDTDNISLNQICKGITTRGGEVLDRGTGLSQNAVLTALKGLISKNTIVSKKNSSKEKGNEPTTYSLNIIPYLSNYTPPSSKTEEALPQKSGTQQTVLQETDIQNRNSNSKLEKNNSKGIAEHHQTLAIGDILKKKMELKPTSSEEAPKPLKFAVQVVSEEFGDRKNMHSNLTRVVNISKKAGKNIESFDQFLFQAMSITKQQGNVKKRMPYFFKVLEEVVGLKTLV